ncbi:hypothetical protein HYT59_01220 [Candidatus Woesebacteria bacterium]|nr:hypothetical protein [Candidatus Woesebacteria bacterium]
MNLEIILLFILTVAIALGAPSYMFYRQKMVELSSGENHTKKRVLKLTIVNVFLNLFVAALFLALFFLVISQAISVNQIIIFLSILFFLTMFLTFYGNGIYITAIVLESYTLQGLKRSTSYGTQFIATHLFHGPISHILVYSGWLLVIFTLSLLEVFVSTEFYQGLMFLTLILGTIAGLVYALGQIYNRTARFQFITGLVCLVFFVLVLAILDIPFLRLPLVSYFFGLILSFNLTLLVYFLTEKLRGREAIWYSAGS